MGLAANIRRDIKFAGGLFRLLKRIKPITLDSDVLACDDIEEAVDRFGPNIAVEDESRKLTYREFEALANRYANWAKSRNLKRSDVIALVMHNRVEYVAAWFGFSKVGVATALINNNLTGAALAHCLTISTAFNVVTDEDCWQAVEDARGLVDRNLMIWVHGLGEENETNARRDLDNAVRSASSAGADLYARLRRGHGLDAEGRPVQRPAAVSLDRGVGRRRLGAAERRADDHAAALLGHAFLARREDDRRDHVRLHRRTVPLSDQQPRKPGREGPQAAAGLRQRPAPRRLARVPEPLRHQGHS